jgi:hypothetical protein
MARYRTVKPEHWSDRRLPELSLGAHLFWIGTWNFSDDEGVFEGDPCLLKADIFPRRRDVTESTIEAWLVELITTGFILKFEYQGVTFYISRTFKVHQKIDKPRPSKIPVETIKRALGAGSSKSRDSSAKPRDKSPCIVEESNSKGGVKESNKEANASGVAGATPGPTKLSVYTALPEKSKKAIIEFIKEHKPEFIEPYCDLWNLMAAARKLPGVSEKIPDSRRRKFAVRIKDPAFDLIKILAKALDSEFILTSTWFSFDWIIANDKNYLKVLEGNYDNKTPEKKPAAGAAPSKTPDQELQYLIERYQEPDFDPKIITPDLYDRMVSSWGILKVGTMARFTGTIEEQKTKAVLDWIKTQATGRGTTASNY